MSYQTELSPVGPCLIRNATKSIALSYRIAPRLVESSHVTPVAILREPPKVLSSRVESYHVESGSVRSSLARMISPAEQFQRLADCHLVRSVRHCRLYFLICLRTAEQLNRTKLCRHRVVLFL